MVAKSYYKVELSLNIFVPSAISKEDALELLANWQKEMAIKLKEAFENDISN